MEVTQVIAEAHASAIICATYSPFQQRLFTGSEDGSIKVWELETGKCERTLNKHEGWVTDLLYCDRYNILFSSSLDGTLVAWSPLLKDFFEKKLRYPVTCLAWDKKKKHLIVGLKEMLWIYRVTKARFDAASNLLEEVAPVHLAPNDFIRCMVWFEGKVACGSFDKTIYIFDSGSGRTILQLPRAHKGAISVIAYDKDNNRFITGGMDKKVKIWHLDGTLLFEIGGFSDVITGLCYVPITRSLWVASNSSQPQIYDPITAVNITEYVNISNRYGEYGHIQKMLYIPYTNEIIGTTSTTRGLVAWKHNPYAPVTTIRASSEVIETLCATRKIGPTQYFFSGGGDGSVQRWEIKETDTRVFGGEKYDGHRNSILDSCFIEKLNFFLTASADKTIRVWSYTSVPLERKSRKAAQGRKPNPLEKLYSLSWLDQKISGLTCVLTLEAHNDRVSAITPVSRHGKEFVISVSWDLSIIVWELSHDTHQQKKIIAGAHEDYILDVAYSEARNEFATCSVDGVVEIWNFDTFENINTLAGHKAEVTCVIWNSFLECWVTGCDDATVRMWSPAGTTLQLIRTPAAVTAMCLDLNFGYIVVGAMDHKIRVYQVQHDTLIQENAGHTDVVTCVMHIPESNMYVSSSWDQTIRLWTTPKEYKKAKATAPEVSPEETSKQKYKQNQALLRDKRNLAMMQYLPPIGSSYTPGSPAPSAPGFSVAYITTGVQNLGNARVPTPGMNSAASTMLLQARGESPSASPSTSRRLTSSKGKRPPTREEARPGTRGSGGRPVSRGQALNPSANVSVEPHVNEDDLGMWWGTDADDHSDDDK